MKKISIIVPVYNTEKYLPRCIESILNQTYKNIEVILVNDGSTDKSGQICDQYFISDDRITVVHKKNTGVSDSRNQGIRVSNGDYLQFVDSDDYIDEDMTEILLQTIEQTKVDLVICGIKSVENITGKCILNNYPKNEMNISVEYFKKIYYNLYICSYINSPCNKLYSANIIKYNNILFDTKFNLGEDLLFNLEVIKKCNKFSILSACLYNYERYDDIHLTNKFREDIYNIQKILFKNVINLYTRRDKEKYSEQLNNFETEYCKTLIDIVISIATNYEFKYICACIAAMKNVRKDEVLNRKINSLKLNFKQEKLIVFFLRRNIYTPIFIYAKTKVFIKQRLPFIFNILRKWSGLS